MSSELPLGIAREYYAAVARLLEAERKIIWQAWMKEIRPLIHRYRRETEALQANRTRPGAAFRVNDALEDIGRIMRRLGLSLDSRLSAPLLESIAERFVGRVTILQSTRWKRQVERVPGIDPADDLWLGGFVEAAVQENVSWIKSIATEYFDEVQTIVLQGARRGESMNDMAAAIAEVGDVSLRRARFIARDQLGSLYGDLTKRRQTQAGLKRFTWRTSQDERVRQSHRELDGKVFTWAEGATVDGKQIWPGNDFNCRCTAEPLLDDILEVSEEDAYDD